MYGGDGILREVEPKRRLHVLGCAQEAVYLAMRWGVNPRTAELAALLHDITKGWSLERHLKYCEKCDIVPTGLEKRDGKLLHAITGAYYARERYAADEEIFEAIRWHTTGRADMSVLGKIIYVADKSEPFRHYDGVEALRQISFQDLDIAVLRGLEKSILTQILARRPMHPATVEARNFLLCGVWSE